jgi:glucose/arabinose dehydrogenase
MRKTTFSILLLVLAAGCGDADPEEALPVTVTTATSVGTPTTTAAPTTTVVTSTTEQPSATTSTTVPSIDDLVIEATEVASGFGQPVFMITPPNDQRRFVVDQTGIIWIIESGDPVVFLDISADVRFSGEQGLLGLAFDPAFAENGYFYISYIDNSGDTVIESVVATGQDADPDSRRQLLRVAQPASNHNGGMIAFGPDGNLWIGLGDGGGANDQFGQGQRVDTMLGAMLRVTVGPGIDDYAIPDGNLQDEVWATGLRNPWRWDFDGNDLWIGDVGQGRIEEVDVVDWTMGNPNFGWSIMEGTECFGGSACESAGLVIPVYEYPHDDGCSITGGVVYRGSAMPELAGQFLFADYCTGWVRSVGRDGVMREWMPAGTFSAVTSFGIDSQGEPYVLTAAGSIYALTRAQ